MIYHSEAPKIPQNQETQPSPMYADEQWIISENLLQEICESNDDELSQAGQILWKTLEKTYLQIHKITTE